jgi:membrane-associated phospholipid phosphatase
VKREAQTNFKAILHSRAVFYSAFAWVCAGVLNAAGSAFIQQRFPVRPQPPDLLFQIFPYYPWLQNATDYANIFSFVLLLSYLGLRKDAVKRLPVAFVSMAVAYALRAALIVLTPLGSPLDDPTALYGITGIKQYGQIPSGHTLMVVLAYMLVSTRDSLLIKVLLGISVLVEVVALVLSHGHYGIDIAVSFLVAYVAVHEVRRVWKAS